MGHAGFRMIPLIGAAVHYCNNQSIIPIITSQREIGKSNLPISIRMNEPFVIREWAITVDSIIILTVCYS